MKSSVFILAIFMIFMLTPVLSTAQTDQISTTIPPISQPLVREGTMAVKLVEALKLGTTPSEVEAESLLASAGIAPYNGWIADYPVTPDIADEVRNAVGDAADSGALSVGKDEALKAFDGVVGEYGLSVESGAAGEASDNTSGESYADNTVINNYYFDEGPPVVTYYAPPPDYAYLYSWVPYPFWWWDFWFPGFFILVDFDRVSIAGRHRERISNHFFDDKDHEFHKVDPAHRSHGRNSADRENARVIGPSRVREGAEAVFNSNRNNAVNSGSRMVGPPPGNGKAISSTRRKSAIASPSVSQPYTGTVTTIAPYGGERTLSLPSGHREYSAPSRGGERTVSSPPAHSESSAPSDGGRTFSPAAHGTLNQTSGSGAGGFRGSFEGHHGR